MFDLAMTVSRDAVRPFRFIGKHEAECDAEGMIKLPEIWLFELGLLRTLYVCKDPLSQDIVLIDGEDFRAKISKMGEEREISERFQEIKVETDGRFQLPREMLETPRVILTGVFDHITVTAHANG